MLQKNEEAGHGPVTCPVLSPICHHVNALYIILLRRFGGRWQMKTKNHCIGDYRSRANSTAVYVEKHLPPSHAFVKPSRCQLGVWASRPHLVV